MCGYAKQVYSQQREMSYIKSEVMYVVQVSLIALIALFE